MNYKLLTILLVISFAKFSFGKNPNLEEVRWGIPQDLWLMKDSFLMKGKYFRITIDKKIGINEKDIVDYFSIYSDVHMKGKPVFSAYSSGILKNGKEACEKKNVGNSILTKNVLECGYGYCEKYSGSEPVEVKSYGHLNINWSQNNELCPYEIPYVVSTYSRGHSESRDLYYITDPGTQFNFKYSGISPDKTSLEILINNKKYYLDIRFCKKHSDSCEFVDYTHSLFEESKIQLKEHQAKKDLPLLNILISSLLPCVKKKDTRCIEKYFITTSDDDVLELGSSFKYQKKIIITQDMINELEACLDYGSVLPHLYGARGVKKVCIFQQRANSGLANNSNETLVGVKLLGIAYPEAVRTRPSTEKVYILPQGF